MRLQVTSMGGLESVIRHKKWPEVAAPFQFPPTFTSKSFTLRKFYTKLLHDYEQVYYFRHTGTAVPPPGQNSSVPQQLHTTVGLFSLGTRTDALSAVPKLDPTRCAQRAPSAALPTAVKTRTKPLKSPGGRVGRLRRGSRGWWQHPSRKAKARRRRRGRSCQAARGEQLPAGCPGRHHLLWRGAAGGPAVADSLHCGDHPCGGGPSGGRRDHGPHRREVRLWLLRDHHSLGL